MPIGLITKPHSTDFHMVTDYSVGEFTLNNFIMKAGLTICLDSLQDFSMELRAIVVFKGHVPMWLFKSDISAAYRQIPMHPLW